MGQESGGKTLRKARSYQLLLDFSDELGLAYAQLVDKTLKAAREILDDISEIETQADFDSADARRKIRTEQLYKELGIDVQAQAPIHFWNDRDHKKSSPES